MNRHRRSKMPKLNKRGITNWIIAISGILLLGLLGNQYAAWNQKLFIVNGFDVPLTVIIDEGDAVTVPSGSHVELSIGEGYHVAVASGKGIEKIDMTFDVENSFTQRWGNNSAFVLNPGGRAVLVKEDIAYTSSEHVGVDNSYELCFGQEFFTFRDVVYPFKKPPSEIKMEGSYEIKRYVGMINGRPVDLIGSFPENTSLETILSFVEHFLTVDPDDSDLLMYYAAFGYGEQNAPRVRAFLGAGLDRRPICVDWHRLYQGFCDTGDDEKVIAEYDKMLAAEPNDSAMLYLRGRLCMGRSESNEYFKRAAKADPKNPYPPHAIAFGLITEGKFEEAKPLAETACKFLPDHLQMKSQLFEIRFAMKEFDALSKEAEVQLVAEPGDIDAQNNLLRILIAQGKTEEAKRANQRYVSRYVKKYGAGNEMRSRALAGGQRRGVDRVLRYLQGNPTGPDEIKSSPGDNERAVQRAVERARFVCGMESGDPKRLKALAADEKLRETGHGVLLLSCAWRVAGDASAAKKCLRQAADNLVSGRRRERGIGRLIKKGDTLKMSDVDELSLTKPIGVTALVALAQSSPSNRDALLDRAEKINTLDVFPHHLIRKTIAVMRNARD